MEKSDFDRLLLRYLKDEVSEQEKIKLEAWLEVMKTEDPATLELSKEDEDKLFRKISGNLNNLKEVVAFRPGKEKKVPISQWVLRIAASVLILSSVAYAVWQITGKQQHIQEIVTKNGVEKIILNDGTLVWLRNESKLVYYEKLGTRYTELNGDALFEVAKDASRPFMIQCGDVTIKVVGTSFNLKTSDHTVELKVLTGRVNLSSEKEKVSFTVEPNEKVIYQDGKTEKLIMDQQEILSVTANTEYNMQFANATMKEVVQRLEDKFNVKITLTDKRIGACHITADFTDHALESALNMISEVLTLAYTRKGDTITITGRGCH